jgi:hypothetical protein
MNNEESRVRRGKTKCFFCPVILKNAGQLKAASA